ncbi:hydrogenase [Rhodobacteraceae bacterium F11138]|nr:hydrogenase [Rhodobacteraceae bacterium F11138]
MARILILGGGLIGCGWAAAFAGSGHDVAVMDPDHSAAERLSETWHEAQPVMAALGTLREATVAPRYIGDIEGSASFDLVQEALPEDLPLKHRALAALEAWIAPETPIASSSSGFTPEMIAQGMTHPDRLFIAHPCNPPYLMPTVELVGQPGSPDAILNQAETLYASMGKTVLRMAKPMRGHLVNRLQFALWREAVHLVASGAASMADVERAVSEGLAPRWCLMGPGGVFHLSGGAAGMAGYLASLGPATTEMWGDLGTPDLTTAHTALISGMGETDPRPTKALAQARDLALPQVMRALGPIRTHYRQQGERE